MKGNYILCEDSNGGAFFWETVNREILSDYFQLMPCFGFGNLWLEFDKLRRSSALNSESIIIIVMDNITKQGARTILDKFRKIKREETYRIEISDYYCIEEVFLSFESLLDWCKYNGSLKREYEKISKSIRLKDVYFDEVITQSDPETKTTKIISQTPGKLMNEVDKVKYVLGGKRYNREGFAKAFYGHIIGSNTKGQFSVERENRDKITTSCWFTDCGIVSQHNLDLCRDTYCGIPENINTAGEKLYTLFCDSFLYYSDIGIDLLEEILDKIDQTDITEDDSIIYEPNCFKESNRFTD